MNKLRYPFIAIIAVALMAAFALNFDAAAQNATRPASSVAVIDINQVLQNLNEARAIQAKLQSQADALQKEAEDREKKIRKIQSELEILMPGADTYATKQAELEEEALSFRIWREYQQNRMERNNVAQLASLYRKIVEEVGALAQAQGYDIVLFKDSINIPGNANQQQLTTIIQMRKLLYSNPNADVTTQVVQRMNNAWENRSGNAGGN